jgi:hypothetical protein
VLSKHTQPALLLPSHPPSPATTMHFLAHCFILLLLGVSLVCASPMHERYDPSALAQRDADPLTNAQRLARGLTPSPPKRLYHPTRMCPR